MVFLRDPCGLLCVFFTYVIVIYADYVILFHTIRPVLKNGFAAIVNAVAFNLIAFLLGFSHLCAVFTDPGIIPVGKYPSTRDNTLEKPPNWTPCLRCSMYRPPRAHHCRVCQRCIRRMDHHCPWVNNCVGEYNQKYFILFLFYVGLLCMYALVLIIICRAVIAGNFDQGEQDKPTAEVVHTILLVCICCIFGLFVMAVLSDQLRSIIYDETPIEALQNGLRSANANSDMDVECGKPRLSRWLLFRQVFGKGPVYLWFLPCYHVIKPCPLDDPVFPLRPSNPNNSTMVSINEKEDISSTDSSSI